MFATIPAGARLEVIRDKAVNEVRIPAAKMDALVQAFDKSPRVRLRSEVSRDKAEKAKRYFMQAGLNVVLVPHLSLEDMTEADKRFVCSACGARVILNTRNACPSCGAVARLVPGGSAPTTRAIAPVERPVEAFDRKALEAALRKQIRAELEAELSPPAGMRTPTKVGVLVTGLLAASVAFGVGHWRADQSAKEALAEARRSPVGAEFDRMLAKLGAASGPSLDGVASMDRLPDAGDSLFAIAGRGPVGGGAADTQELTGLLVLGGLSYANRGTPGASANAMPASGTATLVATASGSAPLPPQHKLVLGIEFARTLFELGQLPRAREAIKALSTSTALALDPGASVALRRLELEVRARSLLESPEALRPQLLESLRVDVLATPEPLDRSIALAQVAAVLAESPGLPAEVPAAYFSWARSALGYLNDPAQRSRATGIFQVASARALLAECLGSARAGNWERLQTQAGSFDALVEQASNSEAALQLLSLALRGRAVAGLDRTPLLVKALELIEKESQIVVRAQWLRRLAEVPRVVQHEKFQAAVERLDKQLEAQPVLLKAQGLTTLSLAYADAGAPAKLAAYRKRALETQGLRPAESVVVHANLLAYGDMAVARQLYTAQAYAEAESRIRRLAAYLM